MQSIDEDGTGERNPASSGWTKTDIVLATNGLIALVSVPIGAYKLHYGATEPDPPRTLANGTIRRLDNSHEDTKGHELHVAPDPEPEILEFPGMVERWERFWSDIPKTEYEIK